MNCLLVSRIWIALYTRSQTDLSISPGKPNWQVELRKRRRGKRAGLHARLKAQATRPPLPSLLLANVRSLQNKMDEICTSVSIQREYRDCCALIFTETWLHEDILDTAISLQTHSVHQSDRTFASGKSKGGGVGIYVNNSWCSDVSIMYKYCSPDI